MRTTFALATTLCALLATAVPASAHVQVLPTVAAPNDPVLFEVLVPNERSESTVEVALKIPAGVLPFSFARTPGWRRTTETKADGTVDVVRWRGRLERDGFARFAFLAGTPEREGDIAWKAAQTYSDGKESAWIGPPGSEEPAAVTKITASAPRQNAGGEGGGEDAGTPAAARGGEEDGDDEDGGDLLALLLGAGGLLLGGVALGVALSARRAARRGGPTPGDPS